MSKELLLMPHVVFGVLAIMTAVWLFVEVFNASEKSKKRIRFSSIATTISLWISYFFGGYWYVYNYAADKAIIKAGTASWAHSVIMETKEHMFLIIIILSVYLSIVVFRNNIVENKNTRKLVLILAGLVIFLSMGMEFFGSLVTKGVKIGLLGGM